MSNIYEEVFCQKKKKKKQLTIRNTVQKLKFSIKDFFNKCDQIRR